ncbi:retrovirus-related Pol polyprotein from transposon 297 [Nephila pilipes]|uniref:Retrovirus-related Pol polyprotein from transposon 297 n=1 Tax=Nephila pilipes TaxID=299642 RepID=A0A8X6TDN9_NEPPI|nr:retrovirus-related Pol polyprotein from transposon 297 [Nephila pilipes]
MQTGGEEIPLFSANIEFPRLCSVFAKEKTIIPARSECLIRRVTKASEHFRYAVTNSPSQISEKGVLAAATLVDLKKETIPVRILNMDNKPKTMDKGAIIASYEPVVDIVAHPQEFSGEQLIQSILENLEGLNEDQRTALQKLLQEFRNLFFTCDADVGQCNVTLHKIDTGDHPPIKQYSRRLPLARKEEAELLVKEMVDNIIIEGSSEPWTSPIVLVKKKDGSTRFCVDYRKLNEITKRLRITKLSKTFVEHLSNIRKVFQRLQKANLKLSPKKCKFFRKEVSYLGYVISSEGVKTDPEKIKAVVDWPRPETVHEL